MGRDETGIAHTKFLQSLSGFSLFEDEILCSLKLCHLCLFLRRTNLLVVSKGKNDW